jgi:hypothetical protein
MALIDHVAASGYARPIGSLFVGPLAHGETVVAFIQITGRSHRWVSTLPRGNWGCADSVGYIGPATYWQKQLRKVLPDSLRSRISGLYVADDSGYGPYEAVN